MENPALRSPGVKKICDARTQDTNKHLFNFVSPFPVSLFSSHPFFTPVLSLFLFIAFVALLGRGGDRTQGLENTKQVFSTNKLHLQHHLIALYPRYSTIETLVSEDREETVGETV